MNRLTLYLSSSSSSSYRNCLFGNASARANDDNAEVRRFRLSIQQIKRNFTSSNGVFHLHKTDKIICLGLRVVIATSREGRPNANVYSNHVGPSSCLSRGRMRHGDRVGHFRESKGSPQIIWVAKVRPRLPILCTPRMTITPTREAVQNCDTDLAGKSNCTNRSWGGGECWKGVRLARYIYTAPASDTVGAWH